MDKYVKKWLDNLDSDKNKNYYGRVYGRELHKKFLIQEMFQDELETMIKTGAIRQQDINPQIRSLLTRAKEKKLTLQSLDASIEIMEQEAEEGDKIVDKIKYLKSLSSANEQKVSAVQHSLESWGELGKYVESRDSKEKTM